MPFGCRIWDSSSTLWLDTSHRTLQFLGMISSSGSGSRNVPEFAKGIPFAMPMGDSDDYIVGLSGISISGTTLSWGGGGVRFVYGIY